MNYSKIVERSGTWGLANNYQDPGDVISKKLRCHCSPINFPNDKQIHHITEKNNEDISFPELVMCEGFRPSLCKISENEELSNLVVKVSAISIKQKRKTEQKRENKYWVFY